MTLPEWLHYLESLPSGLTTHSLAHVKAVATKLAVLNFTSKVITVAGTNGKGSSVVFLEAILLAAGFKVGAYISPHILNYNERIRLNGKNVDDQSLCQAFAVVERMRTNIPLSYFEFSTLAALVIFKEYAPDILLLEVGLGGRYDAVNIVDSDIAMITTIALDHTAVLGNTKEAIGYEKAGIMRPFNPVICGENMPESVYAAAHKLQAKLYGLNKDFFWVRRNASWEWQWGKTIIKNLPLSPLPLPSAALALMVLHLLSPAVNISQAAIVTGLNKAFLTGRYQCLEWAGKAIIFDIAHNFEAATLLATNLAAANISGRVLAVASMFKDKNIALTFAPLVKIVYKWHLGILKSKRAADAAQLAQALQQAGGSNFGLFSTMVAAFQQAIAECQEKDKIVVFGSCQAVAEILKVIKYRKFGE